MQSSKCKPFSLRQSTMLLLLLSTYYLLQCDFWTNVQIKLFLDKQKYIYFIQKIEITAKRLKTGIHNVNKSGLKLIFNIYI
jgi:hypothetical protein